MSKKSLVLFYSWSGNTRRIARIIAEKTGADLRELQPETDYPQNYDEVLSQAKGLKLIDCEMVDTDLSFEKSEVEAVITTPIVSVKNPRSGTITAPSVGEIIMDDPEAQGKVLTCGQTGNACA